MIPHTCHQSDCHCGNCDVAHGNLLSVTRSFPVHNTESDPHLGWLGLACETNTHPILKCMFSLSLPPLHPSTPPPLYSSTPPPLHPSTPHPHTVREELRELAKEFDKSEDDLKSLQSGVGQIVGEVLRQLTEDKCEWLADEMM